MKEGKLNWDDLKEIIDGNKGVDREEVIIKSGVGEDCSVISVKNEEIILSTDPITGAGKGIGNLAVHINCNDIASSGGEPIGILVTILAPLDSTLDDIKNVMKEISSEARALNIEILGGHTEVTSAVNKLIVSCTAVGKCERGRSVATKGAIIGDNIVVTKKLCLEGSAIIANDYREKLTGDLSEEEIEEAQGYAKMLSVVGEGKIAGEFGVNAMHDITEGGVLGALWEVASASGSGFVVYKDKMPISRVTEKICNCFNLNPLRLISSGSMLITCKNGERLVEILGNEGIEAAVIGKITEKKGILVQDGEESEVEPPERDELFEIENK